MTSGPAAAVLGSAWAALVLWAVLDLRPPPRRLASMARRHDVPSAPRGTERRSPLEALGASLLRVARRPVVTGPPARRAGAAAVLTAVTLAVNPALAPVPGVVAWAWPRLAARREERRRLGRFEAALPETVDLLTLAVGAGCNVALAVAAAGRRGKGPLAAELRRVTAEAAGGRRLADALDDLPARAGASVRPLAAALAGCERYGAPLAPTLERMAGEVRRQRRRAAEEAARKVPVALLFPLVTCILPAFALLTVAPLAAGALRQLRL